MVTQFDALYSKLFSIIIGATLNGKNVLPMGSKFFPFIVVPFKTEFSQRGNMLYRSKVGLSIQIPVY